MALTPSAMLPLDTPLPREALIQGLRPVSGGPLEPDRPLLVLFLCPHWPFVRHVEAEISRRQADWGERAGILAICSNSTVTHPQDGPEGMAAQAHRNSWRFPYLHDPDQRVARTFQALRIAVNDELGALERLLERPPTGWCGRFRGISRDLERASMQPRGTRIERSPAG